ncbi:MAG: hypothetical protein WCK15_07150 [Pirellula sp.]
MVRTKRFGVQAGLTAVDRCGNRSEEIPASQASRESRSIERDAFPEAMAVIINSQILVYDTRFGNL